MPVTIIQRRCSFGAKGWVKRLMVLVLVLLGDWGATAGQVVVGLARRVGVEVSVRNLLRRLL